MKECTGSDELAENLGRHMAKLQERNRSHDRWYVVTTNGENVFHVLLRACDCGGLGG